MCILPSISKICLGVLPFSGWKDAKRKRKVKESESAEQKREEAGKGVEDTELAGIVQKHSLTNILDSEHLFI